MQAEQLRVELRLREPWQRFDAERRFALPDLQIIESDECRAGEVLAGRIKPMDCSSFGTRCTPEKPLGAPMVSSEGTCAAYFHYHHEPAETVKH